MKTKTDSKTTKQAAPKPPANAGFRMNYAMTAEESPLQPGDKAIYLGKIKNRKGSEVEILGFRNWHGFVIKYKDGLIGSCIPGALKAIEAKPKAKKAAKATPPVPEAPTAPAATAETPAS